MGLYKEKDTYFCHPLFGGWRIKRATSSRHKDFRVNVKESEQLLEIKFLSSIEDRLPLSCLEDHDSWERFDYILSNQDRISFSDNSKVKFLFKSNAQPLVKHGHSFLISKEENFRDTRVFSSKGIDVWVSDLYDVSVEVSCCSFL